ncbi:Eco57I restriction-modification methylase domain-containing protein [Sphaerotilus sp.]|uniref:Eco57I restriction-modification methylase domain-containing protein n=1 Tax=Sphaerotilus sp. TaxID=2093942 RepID=UPI002ACDDC78|nr:DEAD/DEAH box helicase [Sphaerotilus sp.]MDZ7855912.1 DEAD/DEAH box helicase [Sphaerotilus sp.]
MVHPIAPSTLHRGSMPERAGLPKLQAEQMCLFAADAAAEVTAPQEAQHASQDDTGTTAVPAQRTPWRPADRPVDALAGAPQISWPRLTHADLLGLTGAATKFEANVAAIALLRQCEAEDRAPTDAERRILLRYSGWGGLPASFNLEGEDPSWVERARQLQALLSAEDHESARASVNNSHYTEVHLIEAMWQAVGRFGFSGGRVLEPAAGIGHFVGAMPRGLAERSTVTSIEIDRVSGRMLEALYAPHGVDVRIAPFEKVALPEQWFDLVIGNVPFGKYKVADPSNRPYGRFSIHNYFFGRALDLVRPGGLVCLITSTHTLDARYDAVREYIASQAHLLGAIRLPQGAFSGLAATDVQTDILFLRRRHRAEKVANEWVELGAVPDGLRHPHCHARYLQINAWYAQNPRFCIGQVRLQSNGYEEVPTLVFEGNLEVELRERIAMLPEHVYEPAAVKAASQRVIVPAEPGVRPGSYRLHRGRVHRVDGGEMVDVHEQLNATQRARVTGLCAVRDHARALLDAQLADSGDSRMGHLRAMLNGTYDRYVAKYGCLSTRSNALAFRRDADYPLLLSLEHYDDESGTARKAALFTRRTLTRVIEPSTASEPTEALAASVHWRGRVDPDYMAGLLAAPVPAVLDTLAEAGQIFADPADDEWKTADEYLSGNVKAKLKQAALSGSRYLRNANALQQVQPEDLPPAAIEPRLGAVWIPALDVETFIQQVLELKDSQVSYSAEAGAWSVKYNDWAARQTVKVTQEFGTSRMNAIELVQCALNVQVPTVRDRDPETDRYFVNPDETLAAREKLGLLKERFATWAFEDTERRERLCGIYNALFNATRPRRFDGSHLKLPGFSRCYELHRHQLDAVWRIVQSGNTGLFHVVGAGKTAVCVIASMELRRLRFVSKPCHVVPNHMLEAYTAEFVRLYPNASVLMASKEDLEGDRRRELVSRIATGDWDAVVITHSSFERIKMSPQFTERFIKEIIHEIAMAIRAEKNGDRSNRIIKQLETMKKNWATRLEKLLADKKKDEQLTWELLGIDALFVDEAHLHKNLYRFTKMTRVAGLPMTSSERAFDLFLKTRYTMQIHGHAQRGVVFATATPVANTMAEIHTMMRYLQPRRLEELGLQQFDAWAATFGESVTALEIAPDGSGYRMHTRFARFINVPELMAVFGEVADIRTAQMLNLPVPKLRGGKPRIVTCPSSSALKAFVQTLVHRAEAIRAGRVKPQDDNMLAVTTDGRKAALDFRLVAPAAFFDGQGKIAACVREVLAIWQRTAQFRGAQMVFCDLSSPKGGKTFSVYDDLRQRLIDTGVPEKEVAFVHDAETDAQKASLFKAVREGRVRVLLGSTARMGIGTNVQTRLVALHHLDAPWRPCDVEQREGRILRQGNESEDVEIFRYVTKQSFDSYSWQTLETKARFIAQVMSGDQGIRSLEDVELAALSYAEVKALASGNPLVIEKAGVDAEVAKLSTLFSVWRNQRYANESEVGRLPMSIAALEKKVAAYALDLPRIEAQTLQGICLELGGRKIVGPDAVGDALRGVVKAAKEEVSAGSRMIERIVGHFGGFELGLLASRGEEMPSFYLAGHCLYNAEPFQTGPALVAALLATLNSVAKLHADAQAQLLTRRKRLDDIQMELARPFEHEARLGDLIARQRGLLRQLDLDKDEAGTAATEAEEALQAA